MRFFPNSGFSIFVCVLVFSGGRAHAQVPNKLALVGQWTFQTVIGTSNEQDVIGKGVMKIIPNPKDTAQGLKATIVWLDDNGNGISKREMDGRLQGDQAVFTHMSQRVVKAGGKSVATDVNVVWTLSARANVLIGNRSVDSDEDEPKRVTGERDSAKLMPEVKPVVSAAAVPPERGPSTAEERVRVVKIAADSEQNPFAISTNERAWLTDWVNDIPDLNFNAGSTGNWVKTAMKQTARDMLLFQYMASVMAFQIQNPALEKNQKANEQAGLEGVLRAYETLLKTDPGMASTKLNAALAARAQGSLANFVMRLSGRDVDAH